MPHRPSSEDSARSPHPVGEKTEAHPGRPEGAGHVHCVCESVRTLKARGPLVYPSAAQTLTVLGNYESRCHEVYRCLGHHVHVLSDPMGHSETARHGESTDQGNGETGVFDDQSRGSDQIGDAPAGAVNEEDAFHQTRTNPCGASQSARISRPRD